MKRVTGIGGIFFKAHDTEKMREWYTKHLAIPEEQGGYGLFWWRDDHNPEQRGSTTWSLFKESTDYFAPSASPMMINYRVHNLVELLEALKNEGVQIVGGIDEYEYGKFAWILDPEGNKIELWEPIDAPFDNQNEA
ncbi:MAG: VOC family protein [Candidatus Kapabacteria bacterium]|jgi:predicted enzyme related to lactoylglutathione lyase|nr:VOC family protein [Candidatus Kapabacteria bacterium]